MLIDDILKNMDLRDPKRGYYAFETSILNLLKIHQEKSNKPFFAQTRRSGFDAYAPEGIDNIVGGTGTGGGSWRRSESWRWPGYNCCG